MMFYGKRAPESHTNKTPAFNGMQPSAGVLLMKRSKVWTII